MKYPTLLLISFFAMQELPLKPKEEFDVKLDYQFRNRPAQDINSVHYDETRKEHERRVSTAPLPYLTLNVRILKLSGEETKVKVTNNLTTRAFSRKVEEGTVFPLVVGFTDDVKDRVSAHNYVITFLSPKKTETSKIEILIEEDGTFLVNGEKRGKF
jgi:hypothetical protein